MTQQHRLRIVLVLTALVLFCAAQTSQRAAAQQPEADEQKIEDPVVLAIQESNPSTPEELVRAAVALMKLDQPEQSKDYLANLLAAKPDDSTLAGLHRRFGTAVLLRLARHGKLQPEGGRLADAVLDAAQRAARDPRRLKALIGRLNDPAPEIRRAAIVDLRDARQAAIAPLVSALAAAQDDSHRTRLRNALVEMGVVAVEPLLAMLRESDGQRKAEMILVLGQIGDARAAVNLIRPYLSPQSSPVLRQAAGKALKQIMGSVPSRQDALVYLRRETSVLFDGKLRQPADEEDRIELWHWDAKQHQNVVRKYPARDAALIMAARLAADLHALAPQNKGHVRLYLTTQLELAKLTGGLDRPLAQGKGTAYARAAEAGVAVVEDVLAFAIRRGHLRAAIGAAEVLGQIADAEVLHATHAQPRPLAAALRHPDQRLQFAAAGAIMNIQPTGPYAGSSLLPAALAYLAGAQGRSGVLIADPRPHVADNLRGMFEDLGFAAEVASTGRMLLQRTARSPDYELILLSEAIADPSAGQLLQMLRRDRRAGRLPVAVLSRTADLSRAQRLAELHRLAVGLPHPLDKATLGQYVHRLNTLAGPDRLSPQQRQQHAKAALAWLAQLAADPQKYSFYNLLQ